MSAVTSSLTPEGAPLPRITLRQLAETLRQAHVSVACHGDEASAVLGIFTALDWLRGNVRRAASAVVALHGDFRPRRISHERDRFFR